MKSLLARIGGRLKTRRLPRAPCDCGDFIEALPDTPTFAQLSPYLYRRYDSTMKDKTKTNSIDTDTAAKQEETTTTTSNAAREAYVRAMWFDLHYRCGAQGRCVLCGGPQSNSSTTAEGDNGNSGSDAVLQGEDKATSSSSSSPNMLGSDTLRCRFPCCLTMRPASKGSEVRAVRAAYEDSPAAALLIAAKHSATLASLIRRARDQDDLSGAEKGIQAYVHSLIRQAARGRPLQSRLRGIHHNNEFDDERSIYQPERAFVETGSGSEYYGADDGSFAPAEPKYGPQSAINGVNPLAKEDVAVRGGTAVEKKNGEEEGVAAVWSATAHKPPTSQDTTTSHNTSDGTKGCNEDDADDMHVATSPALLREKVKALYLWRAALLVNLRRDEDAVHSLLNLCDLLPFAHRLPLYTAATNWATLNDMEIIYYRALLQRYASFPLAEEFARNRPLLLPRVFEAVAQLPDEESSRGDDSSLGRERVARHCATVVLGKEIETLLARAQATRFTDDASEDPTTSLCLPLTLHYYRFRLGEAFWRTFFDYLCLPPMPAPEEGGEDSHTTAELDRETSDPTPTHILDAIGRSMLLRHLLLFAAARAREIEQGVVARRVRRHERRVAAARYDKADDAAVANEDTEGPAPSDYDYVLSPAQTQVAQIRIRQLLVMVKTYEDEVAGRREVTGTSTTTDTLPKSEAGGAEKESRT